MNLLLDTHILLWWLDDHPSLSSKARTLIGGGRHRVFISTVSLWEISIKKSLGKLIIPEDFEYVVAKQEMQFLPLKPEHAYKILDLPMHHRDPFDRMLIAQAQYEKFTLITSDACFSDYTISIISGSIKSI
jgi:PIN domain nuclease of toxin-antitoxin system